MPFLAILIAGTLIVFTLLRWVKKGQSHQAEKRQQPKRPERQQKEETSDAVYEERLAEELPLDYEPGKGLIDKQEHRSCKDMIFDIEFETQSIKAFHKLFV